MKRRTQWIVIAIIVIAFAGYGTYMNMQSEASGLQQKEIRIGVIESLSGNAVYYGEQNMKGVEIAKEEMQAKYPEFNIEVVHEDSQYTAQGGVAAYRKIKELQKIDAVITHASPISLAVQPLANNDSILQMAVSSSARTYSSMNDLSFRTSPTTDAEAEALADFIIEKSYENLSILYMNNDIGISITNSLKSKLEERNSSIRIVTEENFNLDNTDFKTQLLKIRENKANAIFVPALASHIALILKQSKEANLTLQFIGFRASEDPILINNAGVLADGFVYSYGFDPSGNGEIQQFSEMFQSKYNTLPDGYAAEGYEGMRLVVIALATCNNNLECAKNYLHNLTSYKSVFGSLSFDENGDVYYEFFIKIVRNGTFVRYP